MAINTELLLHPSDKAALQTLKAIPGFSQLVKAYMGIMNERQMQILNKSSNLQLGEDQMPEYYQMLAPICEKLGIAVPELYLELDVVPNAYTYGDTSPFIVITSGLLETLPDELIPTVIAHECGHIACHHTLYTTIGNLILKGMSRYMTGLASLLTIPIEMAFAYWMRCSEFSADRAAVICDGAPDRMEEVCFRFAGNDKDIHAHTSMEAFIRQAEEYKKMVADDKWNQTLEFIMMSYNDHPLNAVRALECREWAASELFSKVSSLVQYRMSGALAAVCDVPVPESSKGCTHKTKEEMLSVFEKEGFSNLTFVRTIEKGLADSSGQIVSAFIDGEKTFEKGEWVPSDAHIVFTFYEPQTAEEIAAEHPNQILLPQEASFYIGKDYSAVVAAFEGLGFTDVAAVPIMVKRNWLIREGGTVKVSIGDTDQFKQGQWIASDSQVSIVFNRFEDQSPSQSSDANPVANAAADVADAVNSFVGNVGKLFSSKPAALRLPDEYQPIKQPFPADMGLPMDAAGFGMRNDGMSALIVRYNVTEQESMPFENPQAVIDYLHTDMDENTGIIEVGNGTTAKGCPYVYNILKRHIAHEDGPLMGNEYTVNCNVKTGTIIQFVNGSFQEEGTTGTREAMIMPMLLCQGKIDFSLEKGWTCDPYNPDFKNGFLKNASEDASYDKHFPHHPLSEARAFVKFVIENN